MRAAAAQTVLIGPRVIHWSRGSFDPGARRCACWWPGARARLRKRFQLQPSCATNRGSGPRGVEDFPAPRLVRIASISCDQHAHPEPGGHHVELADYVRMIRKSWILIVALVLVALGAAAAYSLTETPEYSASAKVFVSVQSNDTVNDLVQGNTFTQNRVRSYSELVSTPVVLGPVIEELGLSDSVQALASRVTATAPLDTTLIRIDAVSTNAGEAADLANAASQSLASAVNELEAPQASAAASPVRITQVSDAVAPSSPVSPNIPLNLALGLLIGLALAFTAALLRQSLDARIRDAHDIGRITTAPVIGGIPLHPKANTQPLTAQEDPGSARAESFRTLRTNFQFLGGRRGRRSFVFTSPAQGEGKTTTLLNLAIALSEAGRSVVVVDADLRQPAVAELMGLKNDRGLSDVLVGRLAFEDVVQPWSEVGLLEVVPAGSIPPNPSELLGSVPMLELLELLEQRYEYVLLDSTPLLPVTDAAVLSASVGGTVLVVAAGRTRKAQVQGAVNALENIDVAVAGIVLTMLPTTGMNGYRYVGTPPDQASWASFQGKVVPHPVESTSSSFVSRGRRAAQPESVALPPTVDRPTRGDADTGVIQSGVPDPTWPQASGRFDSPMPPGAVEPPRNLEPGQDPK